ncbi:MAG: hypothetical protein KAT71_05445, partial [Gammaproteobacteria bacterium]|nr:hypothetical protein [Gammaproteobacteria bacterium]
MSYTEVTNTTIITPNRRLTRHLKQDFDAVQKSRGNKAWSSIDILPLHAWILRSWQKNSGNKTLLNESQATLLWETILAKTTDQLQLLHPKATIAALQQSYSLLQEWQIDINHPAFANTEDSLLFQKWAKTFKQRCHYNNWLTQAEITEELISFVSKDKISLPKRLTLAGFDQITPDITELLDTLTAKGVLIDYLDPNNKEAEQIRVKLPTSEEELTAMAVWAKKCTKQNPTALIGCIVPNLTMLRSEIAYIFNKINPDNFDISIGEHLSELALIQEALQILQTTPGNLNHSPANWINYFITKLQRETWPKISHKHLITRWEKVLENFASLTLISTKLTTTEALEQLQLLTSKTIYQVARPQANIKILGALEAAGLNFDHLWVMGMQDNNWPSVAHPTPFIPLQLQQQLLMPHCNAAKELEFCSNLTERFRRMADKVIYSYAVQAGEQ